MSKCNHNQRWQIAFPLAALAAALFLAPPLHAETPAPSPQPTGWQEALGLRFSEALARFETLDPQARDREAQLGIAAALLNVQPLTSGNIDRAAAILERLRHTEPQDELAIEATYLLARVEHLHRFTPDTARALSLYDELATKHPEHPLGQMALVKAAMLRLFGPGSHDDKLQLLTQTETQAAALTDPDAQRSFHLMLADVSTLLELSDPKTLAHLLAADQVGFAKRKTAGEVFVRIAELARKLQQPQLARQYYQKFVTEFPRDQRTYLMQERLRELETPTTRPEGTP